MLCVMLAYNVITSLTVYVSLISLCAVVVELFCKHEWVIINVSIGASCSRQMLKFNFVIFISLLLIK
jgi:hypothetical protein